MAQVERIEVLIMIGYVHAREAANYLLDSLYGERYRVRYLNGNLSFSDIDTDHVEHLWQKYGRMDSDAVADAFCENDMMVMPEEIDTFLDDPIASRERVNALLRLHWIETNWWSIEEEMASVMAERDQAEVEDIKYAAGVYL